MYFCNVQFTLYRESPMKAAEFWDSGFWNHFLLLEINEAIPHVMGGAICGKRLIVTSAKGVHNWTVQEVLVEV